MSEKSYDVIESSHRYVLGEIPTGYGIWDRQAGNALVERFPLTEEGIELALDRFAELKRTDRRERWNLPRVVRIATISGASIWLVAGTLAALIFTFDLTSIGLARTFYGLDALGFRLAIGSLVVLAVFVLLRRLKSADSRGASLASFLRPEGPGGQSELILRAILILALIVWIVSSIATEALFRFDPALFGEASMRGAIASQLVSTMAFRAWVASLILLVLTRLPLPPRTVPAALPEDG